MNDSAEDNDVVMTTVDPMEDFGPASKLEIFLPAAIAFIIIVFGLMIASIYKQPRWWKRCARTRSSSSDVTPSRADDKSHDTVFDSDEIEIIARFSRYQNNPTSLLRIAIPCLITIVLGPIAIILVPAMLDYFYPYEESRKVNVNGTLSPFLLPASLVYSLAWGFALQDAFAKFDATDANAKHHCALLKQIRELLLRSRAIKPEHKRTMLSKLSNCTTQWMLRQMGTPNECNAVFYVLDTIEPSEIHRENKIMDFLVDKVMELDSLMEEGYRGANANINMLQWFVMESLSFVAFFGILLINAGSYKTELTMCGLTVFGISAFAYVLSDLDYAFHGAFCVDLSVFIHFLQQIDADYSTLKGKQEIATVFVNPETNLNGRPTKTSV